MSICVRLTYAYTSSIRYAHYEKQSIRHSMNGQSHVHTFRTQVERKFCGRIDMRTVCVCIAQAQAQAQ